MPYNSGTGAYERRATTVIDATPDGDTVAVAIDVKLDQGIDDYVVDLNHHKTNGNHYPVTSTGSDSRFLAQSPAGVVSWADGVVAADAALKDMSNVASGAIAPAKVAQDSSNRFVTDAEKTAWNTPMVGALVWATGDAPLPGTIAAQGVELNRTTYARLWAYAQASGNIAASDGVWTEGQYSPGNGTTTFRTPKVDDRFIRGKSATRAVGLVEEDEFKSHIHNLRVNTTVGAGASSTVLAPCASETPNYITSSYLTAEGGIETRPKALTMLPCIVY